MTTSGFVKKEKVKSILISQPEPESAKSPYYDLAKKYKIKVDFRPFIHVEGIPGKDFRKSKITVTDFKAVIFNSRSSIDHFFRICEELRTRMPQDTKYFCVSEAVALYLQKYILYRKRKVFYGTGTETSLQSIMKKYKDTENFLFPCSSVHKEGLSTFMEKEGFVFEKAVLYKTVSSDLSDLKNLKYDVIVFFSPSGFVSLFENFPDFEQGDTRIATFGNSTAKAAEDAGLRLDIQAPIPESRSMTGALELYIKSVRK